MPTFDTPEPISVTIALAVGDVRIVASDRPDTVVEVRPTDLSQETDVRVAEQTRVEFSAGRLLIKTPKQRGLGIFGRTGSVDVTIELPTGSDLEADAAMASFRCTGRLGECRFKTSAGDVHLDTTGILVLNTGAGTIDVNHVAGDANLGTGTGKIRVREITGSALIKNSNGDNWIGAVGRDLHVKTANGDIVVDRAGASITAATASGDIRVGEVRRGSASLKSAAGAIEIGIRPGTAARLDVNTSYGRVRNLMEAAGGPEPSDETVEVRAHTGYGDIVIRRSTVMEKELR